MSRYPCWLIGKIEPLWGACTDDGKRICFEVSMYMEAKQRQVFMEVGGALPATSEIRETILARHLLARMPVEKRLELLQESLAEALLP
jgi:hypothetical protein